MSKFLVRYEPSSENGQRKVPCPQVEVRAADVYQAAERGAWGLHSQGVHLEGLFWLRVEDLESGRIERLLVRESSQSRELNILSENEERRA